MIFSEQFSKWLAVYKNALAEGLDSAAASDCADARAPIPVKIHVTPHRNVYDGDGEYEIPTVRRHWTAYDYNSAR